LDNENLAIVLGTGFFDYWSQPKPPFNSTVWWGVKPTTFSGRHAQRTHLVFVHFDRLLYNHTNAINL